VKPAVRRLTERQAEAVALAVVFGYVLVVVLPVQAFVHFLKFPQSLKVLLSLFLLSSLGPVLLEGLDQFHGLLLLLKNRATG
jgi:hypothetical protein